MVSCPFAKDQPRGLVNDFKRKNKNCIFSKVNHEPQFHLNESEKCQQFLHFQEHKQRPAPLSSKRSRTDQRFDVNFLNLTVVSVGP